jgi:hypothetical protein
MDKGDGTMKTENILQANRNKYLCGIPRYESDRLFRLIRANGKWSGYDKWSPDGLMLLALDGDTITNMDTGAAYRIQRSDHGAGRKSVQIFSSTGLVSDYADVR